jgi:hypothetical protein
MIKTKVVDLKELYNFVQLIIFHLKSSINKNSLIDTRLYMGLRAASTNSNDRSERTTIIIERRCPGVPSSQEHLCHIQFSFVTLSSRPMKKLKQESTLVQ